MDAVEIVGLAASVSLLAGWRLYLCVFVTGLAMKTGWIELPTHLAALSALSNPWILGAAFVGLVAEFFADKVAWLDSLWDSVHTFVRPVGGALLSLAIVDAGDPVWQMLAFLLGGGGALLTHSAKAGSRALVNTSPEPLSNVIVSSIEDVATGGLLALAVAYPAAAIGVALVLVAFAVVLILLARRALRALRRLGRRLVPAADDRG